MILVAHSLGGFTAPLVCARTTVRRLIFVNPIIRQPGEIAGAWWIILVLRDRALPRPIAAAMHVIASTDDRLFALDFQRRISRERLGQDVEVVPGGHLVALTHPVELVDVRPARVHLNNMLVK